MASTTTENRIFNFWLTLTPAEDLPGTWVAHCLDVDVVTTGDTPMTAIRMAVEAVAMVVLDDMNAGRDPLSRRAPVPFWTELLDTMRDGRPVKPDQVDGLLTGRSDRAAFPLIFRVQRNVEAHVEAKMTRKSDAQQPAYVLSTTPLSAAM